MKACLSIAFASRINFNENFIIKGGWRKRTLKQQISLVEHPNNNENLVLRLYKRKEFHKMFNKFSSVISYIRHLIPGDITYIAYFYKKCKRELPTPFLSWVGKKYGWYVVIEAVK